MAEAAGLAVDAGANLLDTPLDSLLTEVSLLCQPLVKYGATALVTLGSRGVMVVRSGRSVDPLFQKGRYLVNESGEASARYYPVEFVQELANVSGAGDCFASGFICAMLRGCSEAECVNSGLSAALQALHSNSAVPSRMTVPSDASATFIQVS